MKATSGDEYRSSLSVSQLCFGASLSVGPAVALQATSHCGNLRAQHSTWQPSEALSAVKGGSEEGRKELRLFQGRGLSGRGQQATRGGGGPLGKSLKGMGSGTEKGRSLLLGGLGRT